MDPLLDAFTKETGIKVNMVYLKKGMQERLKAEGANSPADLVLTSDIRQPPQPAQGRTSSTQHVEHSGKEYPPTVPSSGRACGTG